jgi:predicted Fe-Mo cluster-binding NifX family protein
MRIAIPIWEDKVSPVMDTATRLLVIEAENMVEASRFETVLEDQDKIRKCYLIQNLGVDILICGAISRPYCRGIMATGIGVISGIAGNPEEILKAYLKGTLSHSRFSMPGCKGNGFRQCQRMAPLEERRNKWIKGKGGNQNKQAKP